MITVHDLSPNVEVIAEGAAPPLPAAVLEAEVAAIWEKEKARWGERLFDGRIFSVAALAPARISGYFVPYRWLIAQRAKPALAATLCVRPLGVSGLLVCADGIMFGRRAAGLTDDQGRWELVPSGGVNPDCADVSGRVDLGRQIRAELAEEAGLEARDATIFNPFCAVEDGDSHVIDIGIALATPLSEHELRARHARLVSPEYSELAIVAKTALSDFVAGHERELVGVSRALLRRKGLI